MLVLSRKKEERIIINDNITITIVECKHDICKLGIEAPPEVTIFREEIYPKERKQDEKRREDG